MTAANWNEPASTTPQHEFRDFEWLARIDPAYEEARRNLARLVWNPDSPALALKYREIIAAVILGCRSYPSIDVHLRRAVVEGATLREVLEGFQTAAILGGFPALHYALPFMIALHEEFGDKILGEPAPAAEVKKSSDVPRPATGAVSRGSRGRQRARSG